MADNKLNQEQLYALMQYAARRLNTTPAAMAKALNEGGVEKLAAGLSPENAARLRQLMAGDGARVRQVLESPQAAALIQKLLQK